MIRTTIFAAGAFWIIAGCGESTMVTCTRGDEGTICPESHIATELAADRWQATLRTTVEDTVEYLQDGNVCALIRRSCVVEECEYRFQDGFGWFVLIDGNPYPTTSTGPDMTAERAIAECLLAYSR